jgi:hypothetical protein
MVVSRGIARLVLAAGACGAMTCPVLAQPLVTGDLTIYYDFNDFTNVVMDGSGNGFNAKVQDGTRNVLDGKTGRPDLVTTGVISNDKSNPKRGSGAIRFTQTDDRWMDPNAPDPSAEVLQDPVFLDLDGSVIVENAPTKVPTSAVTYAAWLNLAPVDTANGWNQDASIIQGSTSDQGHAVPHLQAQQDGSIRLSIRDQNSGNIVNTAGGGSEWTSHPFPNQPEIDSNGAAPEPWPADEWFHVAATYDREADGGAGHFAVYFNGEVIRSGASNGPVAGNDIGQWGPRLFDTRQSFYDGLGIGAVYDSGGRRLHGMMDEFYLFTRALSEEEIQTLVNLTPAGVTGDYNNNGSVDAADYVLWRNGGPLQNEGDTPGTVNAADYEIWRANFAAGSAGGAVAAAVPEPATIAMLLACLSVAAAKRRR